MIIRPATNWLLHFIRYHLTLPRTAADHTLWRDSRPWWRGLTNGTLGSDYFGPSMTRPFTGH